MKLEYYVTSKDTNKEIKDILISKFKISHKLLTTLKKENSIFLNDIPSFAYKKADIGDKITVSFDYVEDNSNIVSKEIPLNIVFEDEWLLVVNKPAGIAVHPSILHYENSLSSGIKFYYDKIGLKKKIRPVNRIDKNTSGLVIFAKNEYIQQCLIYQMNKGIFKKEYIAIVEGFFENDFKIGTINAPIARKENSIIERCVSSNGAPSITKYKVLKECNIHGIRCSVLNCKLETGRTHQIRVHLAYILHPILGDELYGGNMELVDRQALHSYKISFIHPITNKKLLLKASFPKDLIKFL